MGVRIVAGLTVLAASCILAVSAVARPAEPNPPGAGSPYKAVLIAGDTGIPVFDNAVVTMQRRLRAAGVPDADIQRFSTTPRIIASRRAGRATQVSVTRAIGRMSPAPGQACLVFATSHGSQGRGLALTTLEEVLTPAALDAALTAGCGDAPTVAIVSGCFTGDFAGPAMARPNRIVLTAARADRPSFGCGAGRQYTFYDSCLLAVMARAEDWRSVASGTGACVAALEAQAEVQPSEPQVSIGSAAAGLMVPRKARVR